MKAAVLRSHGAVPEYGEFAEPEAADGQSTVRVSAGGMNPVEIAIASGAFYGLVPELPSVVGREGVGLLADGSRVFFSACVPPFGSFAERALVPTAATIALPDDVDDGTAIALWTSGLAAWMPLDRTAAMKEGDSVLVLGASGVVGQIAIQLAKARGAGRLVAAARSEAGLERAHELGADATVALGDVGEEVEAARLREALTEAAGEGFDIVLDLLSGPFTQFGLERLARDGRQVLIGASAGEAVELTSATLRSRNGALRGYSSTVVDPVELVQGYRALLAAAGSGEVRVDWESIPLVEVGTAWRLQAEGPGRKLIVAP
jgi:NADPH2:quinone reductase